MYNDKKISNGLKKYLKISLICVFIICVFVFYYKRVALKERFFNFDQKQQLPQEIFVEEINSQNIDLDNNDIQIPPQDNTNSNNNTTTPSNPLSNDIKSEINLKVPFTIQSPNQKWDNDYKEGCEEASVLMVYSFLNNLDITVSSAMKDIGDMINLQKEIFGGQFDLSVTTTAYLAERFYNLKSEIIELKSIEDIKRIVSNGNPVILPTLGRELKNPNFKSPGPLYHMLVVKGYIKSGLIITNDPGTRKGENYLYDPEILFNAIGDWDANTMSPDASRKVGIFIK